MKQFQIYLNKTIQQGFGDRLAKLGVRNRYMPDSFDFVDEMEFLFPYKPEKNIVLSVAVEGKKIKRIMFGWAKPNAANDDFFRLEENELMDFCAQNENVLTAFFNSLIEEE